MKTLDRILNKFGYIKKGKFLKYRGFQAALINRLTSSWTTTSRSADEEIKAGLKTLRARSRDLIINNDYANRFIALLTVGVLGHNGIILQSKIREPDGRMDDLANTMIENAWSEWGKSVSVCGRYTWRDVERITLSAVAGDGELFLRQIKGFNNKYKYALQLIEADHVDENLNRELAGGNVMKMGIEFNPDNKPIAYHFYKKHPNSGYMTQAANTVIKYPADQIIHVFMQKRIGQSRGYPWMHSAMTRLNMIGAYEEAELIASRVAASKMGFYETPTGEEYVGDETDSDENIYEEVEPGVLAQLPAGWKFNSFNPEHPKGTFQYFMKCILRGIASGLNIPYNSLANDLEGVNYSSLRAGSIEERDYWKTIQAWFIDHFCNPIFANWLQMALISGALPLPLSKYDKFNSPKWQPRGYQWVDPQNEMEANQNAVEQGLTSRSDIVAEQGKDIEDVFEQLSKEQELAKKYNLTFPKKEAKQNV